MKTQFYKSKKDGSICVISCTTRKANYQDIYFGHFTFWQTKEAYEKGDCIGTVELINHYMGEDKTYLPIEGDKIASWLLYKIEAQEAV